MLYILVLTIAFIIIGIFVRSPFIYLAVLACLTGILFSGEFDDNAWILTAIVLLMVWAILATIKTIMANREV